MKAPYCSKSSAVYPADSIEVLKQRLLYYQVLMNYSVVSGYSSGRLVPSRIHRSHYNKPMSSQQVAEMHSIYPDWRALQHDLPQL